MGIPLWVAIGVAVKRENQREAAARKRAKKIKEENSKERKASWENSDYKPEYSYLDTVVFAIKNNPQLKEFFKKVEDKIQDIRFAEGAEIREKAESLAKLAKKYEAEAKKIEEELAESGITLGAAEQSAYYDLNSFNPRSRDYAINEQDDSFESKVFERYTEFNGAELTMQDVCDSYNTSYEGIIGELTKDISEYKVTREKLQKKLNWLSKERKIYLLNPDKSGQKSYELSKKISKLDAQIAAKEKAKNKYEVLSNLTPEQKDKVIKYMEAHECIDKICRQIHWDLADKYYYSLSPMSKKENVVNAINMLEKEESVTKEEFTAVFVELEDIKSGKKKYNVNSTEWSCLSAIAKTFIDFVDEEKDKLDSEKSEESKLNEEDFSIEDR